MCPSPPGRTRCPSPSTWPSSSPLASSATSSPCSPSLTLGSTTNGAFLGCLPDFLVFCCRCKYCHHHHHHHHYDHLVLKGAHFDHCPHSPPSIVRSPLLHHRHALPDVHLCQRFFEVNQSCDMVSILHLSSSSTSCSWVAWTRNLVAYADMITMAAIALVRCLYITCNQVYERCLDGQT